MSDDTVVAEVYTENIKEESFDWNADQVDIKVKLLKCGEIYTLDNVEAPSEEKEGNGNVDLDFLLSEYKVRSETEECIEISSDDDSTSDNTASNHQDIMHKELSEPESDFTCTAKKPLCDFVCKLCGSPLQNYASLRKHLTHQHKFIECKCCQKICVNQEQFEKHFITHIHDVESPHKIKKCRLVYTNLVYDNRPKKKCTKCEKLVPVDKKHDCVLKYRQKIYQMLKQHSTKHSSVKPFKCPCCDLQFETSELLKTHQNARLHFSFTCDCDREFKTIEDLKMHRSICLSLPQ
ncbi:zinc finger protein 81-like isoform X2 [Hermetia illucens]|uniref:zinc finger protein 81-like isoform X2 n=1 Tax=Hermetia illucens TaxID=343691 RepID=UPI0018CBF40F|nr:zinc finger protein 81-like isoform X2 [Hermetia illucens]